LIGSSSGGSGVTPLLQLLPAVLPQLLLLSHRVQGSRQSCAETVCRVLLDLRTASLKALSTVDGTAAVPCSTGSNVRHIGLLLLSAVAAVREVLPAGGPGASCWQDLLLLVAGDS
jgi:hypothetical protein